jgi:hypothetical protein
MLGRDMQRLNVLLSHLSPTAAPSVAVAATHTTAATFAMHPAARLRGKVAIVTGSASGLGRGIAEHFASHGASVVIADLNVDAARSVAAALPSALAVGVDVCDEEVKHVKGFRDSC